MTVRERKIGKKRKKKIVREKGRKEDRENERKKKDLHSKTEIFPRIFSTSYTGLRAKLYPGIFGARRGCNLGCHTSIYRISHINPKKINE